jgi:hypothetical protein
LCLLFVVVHLFFSKVDSTLMSNESGINITMLINKRQATRSSNKHREQAKATKRTQRK